MWNKNSDLCPILNLYLNIYIKVNLFALIGFLITKFSINIILLLTLPGRACSAFLDTFHPSFSIVHRGWNLIYIASGILQ